MPKQIQVGPSWMEVFFGALISLVIGVVLAGVFMMLKPPTVVKEPPKDAKEAAKEAAKEGERKADTIYFMAGSRDSNKGREFAAKRKVFVQGGSVSVTEDEINMALPATSTPVAPPPPGKGAPPPPPTKPKEAAKADAPSIGAEASLPNFRIRDGIVQMVAPVKISTFGYTNTVTVLARGNFVKKGDVFEFEPASVSAGSLSLDRIPFMRTLVFNKFVSLQTVPEDIAAAWPKLADVQVEGNVLQLKMQ